LKEDVNGRNKSGHDERVKSGPDGRVKKYPANTPK
jgi:hypothetical protein